MLYILGISEKKNLTINECFIQLITNNNNVIANAIFWLIYLFLWELIFVLQISNLMIYLIFLMSNKSDTEIDY